MRLPEYDMEFLVQQVNAVVKEAIRHGGDSGGAYYTNHKKLFSALTYLKNWLGLDGYAVVDFSGELYLAKLAGEERDD